MMASLTFEIQVGTDSVVSSISMLEDEDVSPLFMGETG